MHSHRHPIYINDQLQCQNIQKHITTIHVVVAAQVHKTKEYRQSIIFDHQHRHGMQIVRAGQSGSPRDSGTGNIDSWWLCASI